MVEVFRVHLVEAPEVPGHIGQEDGDVDQVGAAGAGGGEHLIQIGNHLPRLCFDVPAGQAAFRIVFVTRHLVAARHARPQSRQKQQIAHAAGVRVGADGAWGGVCLYVTIHSAYPGWNHEHTKYTFKPQITQISTDLISSFFNLWKSV